MSRYINLAGQKFERWTVLKEDGRSKYSNILWLCRCKCGNINRVTTAGLKSGKSKSCGCLAKELTSKRSQTHGKTKTPLHRIWCGMRKRCNSENCDAYHNYGGRGIKLCKEWQEDFMSFHNWAIKNGYKNKLTIDRIDVNGNYEPNNCRWITKAEQSSNMRTNIKYKGETMAQASRRLGLSRGIVHDRIKRGWSKQKAFTQPSLAKLKD